jgi:2-polyprenyl-3-methyl-5-hydroxy-6-metoxy-1,4-benzoquinol methylase
MSYLRFARLDPLPETEGRQEEFSEQKTHARNTKKRSALRTFSRDLKKLYSRMTHRTKDGIFGQKLSRYLALNAKVLDVGCGDGGALCTLKDKFICTGIDISEYQVDLAKKTGL